MPRSDWGGRRRGFLALMAGVEVFAHLVAAYDGPPAVRARRDVPEPGQNVSLGLRHGRHVPAPVDDLLRSGTFRGSARVPLNGIILPPREAPTLVAGMGLAFAHRSEFG